MSYYNNFLFSEAFLKESIDTKKNEFDYAVMENVITTLKDWFEPFKGKKVVNKREYIKEFLDVCLDVLEFHSKALNENVRLLNTNKKVDENPISLCYLFDKEFDIEIKTKGNFIPYKAIKHGVENNIDWVMVTNGLKWRLYNVKNINKYEEYLEIDLTEFFNSEKEVQYEDVYLFYKFFHARAFYKNTNDTTFINEAKMESDNKKDHIENLLKSKIDNILHDICYGFKNNIDNEGKSSKEITKEIYQDSIIMLYRLLFYGYAESRNLLPLKEDSEYANISFEKICNEALNFVNEEKKSLRLDDYDFWEYLDKHLRIYTDRIYNGGLFTNEGREILGNFRISNRFLAKCLVDLSYINNEPINFKDLSIRNLGSIYEGILEFNLYVAEEMLVKRDKDGKTTFESARLNPPKTNEHKKIIQVGEIYLSQNAKERKESGSYYTPEDVVNYIVKMTVERKVNELKIEHSINTPTQLREIGNAIINGKEQELMDIDNKNLKFINDIILNLSIIDSSMGSGHFLVNAVYNLANLIIEILCENDYVNEEINVDPIYWRRRVVENCIYGIDKNYLAVHLSKLSLWLASVKKNSPFPFVDHQLKLGNSVLGLEIKEELEKNVELDKEMVHRILEEAIDKHNQIKELTKDNKDTVYEKKSIYEETQFRTQELKRQFDFSIAKELYLNQFKTKEKQKKLLEMQINYEKFETTLTNIMKEEKFFHWELEFPSVFEKGGFDIFIGNPPYIEITKEEYFPIKNTKSCGNIYTHIIEKTFNSIKNGGMFGVILPSASVSTPRMKPFQDFITENSSETHISTYDDRPSKIFTSLDVLKVAIIINKKGHKQKNKLWVTGYNRWYHNERETLFDKLNYYELKKHKYIDGYIPKINSDVELSILNKVFAKKDTCQKYFSINDPLNKNNIYYGYGARYWIKMLKGTDDESNRKSTGEKFLTINDDISKEIFIALFSSSLFYWYYIQFSDCRNVTQNTLKNFPFHLESLNKEIEDELIELSNKLTKDYFSNSKVMKVKHKGTGELIQRQYKIRMSKHILDDIDKTLAKYYGFTKEELNFIINYQIKFRMGENE